MAVFFLIFVGGFVRMSGSGMGCPDWPKCFGRWAPPADASALPGNYKDVYAASRSKKNIRFARYLKAVGFESTAAALLNDDSVRSETDFNPTKAWIEYANRVVGVIVGFLIAALFFKSWKLRKAYPTIFYPSLSTLIAVIFQGWFGSIVVSTNLTSWTITIHMFIALLIVALLVRIYALSGVNDARISVNRWILLGCIITLLIQVFFGTNVREAVDVVAASLPRADWVDALGMPFLIHRSFSLVVLLFHVLLIVKLGKTMAAKALPRALIILILGTFLTGVAMAFLSMPAILQPVHLALATMTFGIQYYFLLQGKAELAR